jgi:hypothetical protein
MTGEAWEATGAPQAPANASQASLAGVAAVQLDPPGMRIASRRRVRGSVRTDGPARLRLRGGGSGGRA